MDQTYVSGAPTSALESGSARADYVRGMFARITQDYDKVNRIQSMGLDQRWRRRALELLELPEAGYMLDACCGTGDIAMLARRQRPNLHVIGSDFCSPMVAEAHRKDPGRPWLVGDSMRLPFADGTFARASVGFGVRNLADLDAGLRELLRVLEPGGRLAILESSRCVIPGVRFFSELYLTYGIPLLGSLLSRDGEAYRYLPETILRFPDQPGLVARMQEAGFVDVRYENQLFGVVAIHVGSKPA